MKKKFDDYLTSLNIVVTTEELSKVGGVSEDMARKYKNGKNLPRLDTAIKYEDKLNLPVRIWLELKGLV